MKKTALLFSLVAMSWILGCGSSNYLNISPGAFGSCDSTGESQCYDFVGLGASSVGSCAGYGSTFSLSSNACPTTSLVGSCTINSLSGISVLRYYSDGGTPFTSQAAQSSCTSLAGTYQSS